MNELRSYKKRTYHDFLNTLNNFVTARIQGIGQFKKNKDTKEQTYICLPHIASY